MKKSTVFCIVLVAVFVSCGALLRQSHPAAGIAFAAAAAIFATLGFIISWKERKSRG